MIWSHKTQLCIGIAFITANAFIVCESNADQPESSVECMEGFEPLLIEYGQYTVGCAISPASDLDRFEFEGSAGDQVRLTLRSLAGGLDPNIEIRDDSNKTIATNWCNGSCCSVCTVVIETQLLTSGIFTIFVSEIGSDESGSYRLQLERIPPIDLPTKKVFNTSIFDTINPTTDHDFFYFEGLTGTEIQLILSSHSGGFDPRLELYLPSGGEPYQNEWCNGSCCSTCVVNINSLILPESGQYIVVVSDVGADENGWNYELALNCFFGDCECLESDLDGDGQIGVSDLLLLFANWGPCAEPCSVGVVELPDSCPGDIIRDCNVGTSDLLKMFTFWGPCK